MSKRQVDGVLDGDPKPAEKQSKTKADDDLEYVYSTVDTSTKSQRLFTEQNVTNIATLLEKESELKEAKLPDINKSTQKQLHNFCLWYQGFYEKNNRDADWKPHFDEDSLAEFESNRIRAAMDTSNNSSGGLLDGDMELICEELDVPKRTRQQLAELGITSAKALLSKKTELEMFSLTNIKKTTQKALLKICLWHEDFYRKHEDTVSWQTHFNDESFASFEQEPSVERDYRQALDRIHEGQEDGGISNVSDEMVNYAATITTRYLTKQLVQQCREKFSPFDVAIKCHKALMHPRGAPHETIHLVSGKTQSGKSTVKAVCAAVHRQLGCLLIVITKGVAERDDLKIKLNNLLGGCRETMDAGLLVIADTGGQIAKATSAVLKIRADLPHARFGVIVDECDAMYRTKDCAQIMEKRYAGLMKLGPSFRMEISATIYSALQALDEQGKDVELMEISTIKDYSGINEMKHLQLESGKDVFLNVNNIGPSKGVKYNNGDPQFTKINTPLLFADTYEVNGKCSGCKAGLGCEMHSDIISKRSWAVSGDLIPYTSQPMMDMFNHLLPSSKNSQKLEGSVCPGHQEGPHGDAGQQPMDISDSEEPMSSEAAETIEEDKGQKTGSVDIQMESTSNKIDTSAKDDLDMSDGTPATEDKCAEEAVSIVSNGDKQEMAGVVPETENSAESQDTHDDQIPSEQPETMVLDKGEDVVLKDTKEPLVLDSHDNSRQKKGLLVLVATNPRVYADGNVIEQAACVQNHFHNQGKDFVAVVATGVGVYFRFPDCTEGRFLRRSLNTVSEIIEQIDKAVGLGTPIIIFGYSRMCRCVSFRSFKRVPTHMILSRGPGYSLEDYIQALGRATFNGLSVLKENGHSHVTILTNEDDFQAAKKYYRFVQAVNVKLSNNPAISLVEALRSASAKLPDEANFFRHTNRKVGRRKDLKLKAPDRDAFEGPSSLEDAENKKKRYWEDKLAQRLMKIFLEMAEGNEGFGCCTDELVEQYQMVYPALDDNMETPTGKVHLKKSMTALEKDVIFEKVRREDDNELQWSAKSLLVLEFMINENLEEKDDGEEDSWAHTANEEKHDLDEYNCAVIANEENDDNHNAD